MASTRRQTKSQIVVVENGEARSRTDEVTTEEPLEIRLASPQKTVAITMRTPGADFDLVAGFLYGEGIITRRDDIAQMSYCVDPEIDGEQRQNIVNIKLRSGLNPDFASLDRHFFTTSACGVCGKASIEALKLRGHRFPTPDFAVSPETIYRLPERLRNAQSVFEKTGGIHAAALFDLEGNVLKLREDVGRHNAVDKLIGSAILADELPLNRHILMVSGRTSYEILQKCLAAGVAVVCAVSAPSSLAVAIAREFRITLIGFLRGRRFNIYSEPKRILL